MSQGRNLRFPAAECPGVSVTGEPRRCIAGTAGGTTPGQSRVQLYTTVQDSGLTLGHLKQNQDNKRLADRGHGRQPEQGRRTHQAPGAADVVAFGLRAKAERRPFFGHAVVDRRAAQRHAKRAGTTGHDRARIGAGPGRRLLSPAAPCTARLFRQQDIRQRSQARRHDIEDVDETFLLESEKGNKQLARKPRKRGGVASKRGISSELVNIVVARDRARQTIDFIAGRGALTAAAFSAILCRYTLLFRP